VTCFQQGLAYTFIASETAAYLGRPLEELNIIAAQLGGGASVCAIKQGKSYDTSMGFTPLEGLPGATRSGVSAGSVLNLNRLLILRLDALQNVDPCLGYHLIPASLSRQDPSKLTRKIGDVELATSEYLLNKDSGFKALAGTGDFEMIVSGIKSFGGLLDESERKRYKLTFDLFVGEFAFCKIICDLSF
jgi:acetate kinase